MLTHLSPHRYLYFALSHSLTALVLFWPSTSSAPQIPYLDIIAHLGLFSITGYFTCLVFNKRKITALLILIIYALASELIQKYFLPARSFEWLDFLNDTAGIIIGFIFVLASLRQKVEL